MARPIHSLHHSDRVAAASEHAGKVCTVKYRRNKVTTDVQTIVARVLGACHNLTNGNSTGDLVLLPQQPGHAFQVSGVQHEVVAIALSNLLSIEPAEGQ